jgi:hypothetical protein
MENNQHPKTIAGAADMLSNHKRDPRSNQGKHQQRKSWHTPKKEDNNDASSVTGSETSFVQGGKDQICRCCGKKGQISPERPDEKAIKKKDWCVCKTQLNTQAEQQQDEQDCSKSTMDHTTP